MAKIIKQHGALREDKTGKLRRDLIPIEQLRRVAQRYTDGAAAHGDRNWEGGDLEFAELCKQSAYRHFFSWANGETGEYHMSGVIFNLFAYDFLQDKHKDVPTNPPQST